MAKTTVLNAGEWSSLLSYVRGMVMETPQIMDADIHVAVGKKNPDYATSLIVDATRIARNFHVAYSHYFIAMRPLDYGNEGCERAAAEYVITELRISASVVASAFTRARAELKERAFKAMEKLAEEHMSYYDTSFSPPKVAARIADYLPPLTSNLYGMLIVVIAKQMKVMQLQHNQLSAEMVAEKEKENAFARVEMERRAKEAMAAEEARLAEIAAKKAALEARKLRKLAAKHARRQDIFARPRVRINVGDQNYFAFDVSWEEAGMLDDKTHAVINGQVYRINKSRGGQFKGVSEITGATIITAGGQMIASPVVSSVVINHFDYRRAQMIWVTCGGKTVKAIVVPEEYMHGCPIENVDGLYIVNEAIGGRLFYKTASGVTQCGICQPATAEEKKTAKWPCRKAA